MHLEMTTMERRCFLAAIATAVVFSAVAPAPATAGSKIRYAADWTATIAGGRDSADEIAAKHGFINLGQVGNLREVYHFRLPPSVNASQAVNDSETKTLDSISLHTQAQEMDKERTSLLMKEKMVVEAKQQMLKKHTKRAYSPPEDARWSAQWSLQNTGQTSGPAGLDLNVQPVWMEGTTGQGTVVAVVDDGLERSHPDLSPNYDSYASYNFVDFNGNPTPNYINEDSHGTSCAGEIAMARNSQCGVGVAYECNIAGIRVDLGSSSDVLEAQSLGYKNNYIQIYSNSWGPADYGFFVSGPDTLLQQTFKNGVAEGRDGKGSIYIWAAGNGGRYYDSCAADGYASSIYTIAVGSADQYGRQAAFDENCASKMAVTYSYNSDTYPDIDSTWDPYQQIVTTTLYQGCTDDFTGTSASAPLLSGVMALVLQANPDLSWRDVQYLIAYTSNSAPLVGGEWTTNGAGLKVSHSFGFGAIDAEAMVTWAKSWISVPEQSSLTVQPQVSNRYFLLYPCSFYFCSFHQNICLNASYARHNSPITTHFSINGGDVLYLEHVVVKMSLTIGGYSNSYDYTDLYDYLDYYYDRDFDPKAHTGNSERDLYDWLENSHTRRGDIQIELTSPQGTKSILLPYRNYDFVNEEGYDSWPFMSVHHWGEDPVGSWELKVIFKSSEGYVKMSGVSVTLYGTATEPVLSSKPTGKPGKPATESLSGSAASNENDSSGQSSKTLIGVIIGGTIGGAALITLLLVLVAIAAVFVYKYKKRCSPPAFIPLHVNASKVENA